MPSLFVTVTRVSDGYARTLELRHDGAFFELDRDFVSRRMPRMAAHLRVCRRNGVRVFRCDGRALIRVLRGNPLQLEIRGRRPSLLGRDMRARDVEGSIVKLCTPDHVEGHEHTRFDVSVLVGMDLTDAPPDSPGRHS